MSPRMLGIVCVPIGVLISLVQSAAGRLSQAAFT